MAYELIFVIILIALAVFYLIPTGTNFYFALFGKEFQFTVTSTSIS